MSCDLERHNMSFVEIALFAAAIFDLYFASIESNGSHRCLQIPTTNQKSSRLQVALKVLKWKNYKFRVVKRDKISNTFKIKVSEPVYKTVGIFYLSRPSYFLK